MTESPFVFEEEEDEEEDALGGADDFFFSEGASRRRCSRLAQKRTLSALDDVPAERLADCVHSLMAASKGETLGRAQTGLHAAWSSYLQAGFSLLVHGLGSKRPLLEDYSALLAESGPVFTLHGHASGASVRELLHDIFHALRLPVPAGNTAVLCSHLRRACTAGKASGQGTGGGSSLAAVRGAASMQGPHTADAILKHVLNLLPARAEAFVTPFQPRPGGLGGDSEASEPAAASRPECAGGYDEACHGSASRPCRDSTAAPSGPRVHGAGRGKSSAGGRAKGPVGGRGGGEHKNEGPPAAAAETPRGASGGGKKTCGTPGCTLPDFHLGPCSTERCSMPIVDAADTGGLPGKRLRRNREDAALDRLDWDGAAPAAGARGPNGAAAAAAAAGRVPPHLYLVVHGMDAPSLRSEASQSVLAALAALPQIHLVASVHHRSAALLWDAQQARQLNAVWVEASTGAPSCTESLDTVHTLLENLQDGAHSGEGRSAQVVLDALTANARQAFRVLLQHQLAEPKSAGLSFHQLYADCRAELCVSSEAALKGHVTEFTDHHLVRTRRGAGDKQCYFCTLPRELMEQIVSSGG